MCIYIETGLQGLQGLQVPERYRFLCYTSGFLRCSKALQMCNSAAAICNVYSNARKIYSKRLGSYRRYR